VVYEPTEAVWDKLREKGPGWDREALLARFRQWSDDKWAKRFTEGEQPS
jgi:hypothetical protein